MIAIYEAQSKALSTIVDTLPTGFDNVTYGSATITEAPNGTTRVWDRASTSVVTLTPAPTYGFGVFHEQFVDSGLDTSWTWYYHVGPVAFQVKATTAGQSAQPTVNQAKAYAAANSTDEQFHQALTWVLNYRDRLAVALAAAGVSDPTTNARYQKCQNLAGVIGGML